MSVPGWEGILDDGEDILWQGRPDTRIVFNPANVITFLFGLAFAAFALFWMIMAASAGGFFWAFGLIHFSVGFGISFGAIFWDAFKRARTWYTLTGPRAFIATELPVLGKSLKSYPIDADTMLDFREGHPSSIFFAAEQRRGKNSTYTVNIGFQRIADGRAVYQIFRDIQKAAA